MLTIAIFSVRRKYLWLKKFRFDSKSFALFHTIHGRQIVTMVASVFGCQRIRPSHVTYQCSVVESGQGWKLVQGRASVSVCLASDVWSKKDRLAAAKRSFRNSGRPWHQLNDWIVVIITSWWGFQCSVPKASLCRSEMGFNVRIM